jgi:hypothetical protein
MSITGGPNLVQNNLVLELDAGNTKSYPGTGITWFDRSVSRIDGTLTNGPTFSTGSGGSIVFDGTDDYVLLPNSYATQLTSLSFTINLWFNSSNWDKTFQTLFSKGDDSWRVHRWFATNPTTLAFGTSGLSQVDTLTATTFATNTWYNITCIYDGSAKFIYVNGIIDAAVSVTGTLALGAFPPMIGENAQATGRYFNGRIPIVQIYHKALSAQEVLQNYNALKSRFGL